MDFLKTLLAYMAATFVVAVESTATPSVTPVPTPGPAATGPAYTVTETLEPAATETPVPTVSVTPAPVPTITANVRGYHNLKMGDRGDEVRKLQQRLIELGYLPEGADDGAFGGQTRTAVRWFQYYNGLTVDGIAGRKTQTNLFENPDIAPMPTPEPTPEATPVPEPTPEITVAPEAEETAGKTDEESDEGTGENVYEGPGASDVTDAPAETAEAAESGKTETAEAEKNDQSAEPAVPEETKAVETGTPISSEEPTETAEPVGTEPAETEPAESAAPVITAEPTQTPEPTVTPYIAATPTQIPWGDEVETAEPAPATTEMTETAEPAESTETAETTETPTETADAAETEAPAEEPKGENEDAGAETENATATGEIVEEINLDEPAPTLTPEPEAERAEYTDLAGWIVFNDGENPLQWTEEEDGVHLVRSPRMQAAGEDIRVSLDDLVKSIPGWMLYKEESSLILEAQGYTIGMLEESDGLVATADGVEFTALADDFSFGEGHFIRVGFLCGALDGEWEWNPEEETLFLRIPEKAD